MLHSIRSKYRVTVAWHQGNSYLGKSHRFHQRPLGPFWEIAEALGYKPEISKEKVTLITASGVETAPLIEIKKIKFLGEDIDNVPVVCHDLPPKSYVTGLLGSSFLRHFKITIDYLRGMLEISRE